MSVINPNINFPDKKKPQKTQPHHGSSGKVSTSSISWTYDWRPFKKWLTIILAAISLAGTTWMIRQQVLDKENLKNAKIEAKQDREKYLKRRLESVKEETIAAQSLKIAAKEKKINITEPKKPRQNSGRKIYTWINENGQTVYSNRPREK